jgi:PAS domain S-box-containing protein
MDSSQRQKKNKIKFGLFARMLTALFILVVSALAILSVSLLKNAEQQFNDFRLQHTKSMVQTLAEASLDALITEDYELLERFVKSSLPSHHNGAYAYLSRPNGQILSSTDLNLIATKITLPEMLNVDTISRTLTYKNRPVIEVTHKSYIGKKYLANAHIAYFIDEGNFSYLGQAQDIIIALLALLIVILIGTYIIVSRIKNPVLSLINTVTNASHDSPIHLPQQLYSRKDEVGTLARSFDNVFTRLSAANKEINEAKNNLEFQVQQRTQQLHDKNNELNATQQRINAIMDNAGDSIISINEKGLIESFNIAAQNLFGYSFDEIQGKNINTLMPEPYHSAHDNYLKQYMKTGIQHIIAKGGREVTGKRKDNSEFPMELLVNHIKVHGENLFIGIVRDITLQKNAQDTLQHSNELLEEKVNRRTMELKVNNDELIVTRDAALDASKIKTEFLSTISHELRTPLHAITGYGNLLSMTELNREQSKHCKQINSGAQNLLKIINDILDFSAFESGELKIENQTFSITNTLQDICNMFSQSAKQKGLEFSYFINEDVLPASIYTDPKRLRQIIVILISNAIKFTQHGSIKINTELSKNLNGTTYIEVSVTDTGIGIEKKECQRIFTPFYQVDGSITRLYSGVGLGLAMSNKIAELMDGKISLQSHPGQGSTFTLSLPLVIKEEEPSSKKSNKVLAEDNNIIETAIQNETNPVPDKKIIIVEDDEVNAELLTLFVNNFGYSADIAENGEIFLDMMAKNNYDLVLMDCQMPILNGYDATKQYRSTEKTNTHVPIIAVTANAMDGDREKCLTSGMDDYIAKPVEPKTLEKIINHWLNSSQTKALH